MKLRRLSQLPTEFVRHNPAIQKKVLLQPGELPHLTNFSQARLAPGQVAPAHDHSDMVEVFFVEAGQGAIAIDGVSYPLAPGDCVAVEPGEAHEVSNPGTQDLVITYFGILL